MEKAEGPDREIDGRVWCATGGLPFVMWDGAGCVHRWEHGIWHVAADRVPRYTSSIDACVALIEKVLPGWDEWEIATRRNKTRFIAHVAKGSTAAYGQSVTAPLALLSATLSALIMDGGRVAAKPLPINRAAAAQAKRKAEHIASGIEGAVCFRAIDTDAEDESGADCFVVEVAGAIVSVVYVEEPEVAVSVIDAPGRFKAAKE